MIITFYDKNFNALQDNASLNVGEWSLTKRAVDYDDFTATCEPFLEKINPTFVVFKDDYGRYKYGAFAGIPELTKDNQTKLQASDLKTIFNNEILAQFSSYTYLYNYFEDLFDAFDTQAVQESFTIEYDLSNITGISITDLAPETDLKSYNVWEDCIVPYLKYYNIFIETSLNIKQKKIIFTLKLCNDKTIPLRLWEYDIKNYGKYITSINETQGVVIYNNTSYYGFKWILTANNSITTAATNRDLYPIKKKLVIKETEDPNEINQLKNEANVEALKTLVEARYQESFTIQVDNDRRYNDVNFDTSFNVYSERGQFYKFLPLGEIIENNKGQKTIKIGYKPDDIVYYI